MTFVAFAKEMAAEHLDWLMALPPNLAAQKANLLDQKGVLIVARHGHCCATCQGLTVPGMGPDTAAVAPLPAS